MHWFFFILISITGYGFYNFFNKLSIDHISAPAAVAICHLTSGILALVVSLLLSYIGYDKMVISKTGAFYSTMAGMSLFFGAGGLFWLYKSGMALAVGLTSVMIGAIILGTIMAAFFLKEELTLHQGAGLVLAAFSIYLLVK